jgi:hypothetical protein
VHAGLRLVRSLDEVTSGEGRVVKSLASHDEAVTPDLTPNRTFKSSAGLAFGIPVPYTMKHN